MEEKGSGFDKIEADYKGDEDKYKPYVSADAQSFTLTLPDVTFEGGVITENSEIANVYVDSVLDGKNDLTILGYCYGRGKSAKEIALYISVTPSTYFRKNVLGRLVGQKLLLESKSGSVVKYIANMEKVKLKV